MPTKLSLGANAAPEVSTSNKAGRHDLIIEPGDAFTGRYKFYDVDEFGHYLPYDISKYSISASAHSDNWDASTPPPAVQPGIKINFIITKSDDDPVTGVIHVVKFTLTAADTTTIAKNPWYTWGMRFVETLNNSNSFTLVTGLVYAQEASLI